MNRRLLPALFACVSAVLLWAAWALPSDGPFGPGAGLFPTFIAGLCLALAVLLTFMPHLLGAGEDTEEAALAAADRRCLISYVLGILLLAMSVYTGFLIASVLISVVVVWYGEGRPLRSALIFGVLCGLVTVIGLGGLLAVDLPASGLDSALMRLVR